MLYRIACLENGCVLLQLRVYSDTQKKNNIIRSVKEIFLKPVLT